MSNKIKNYFISRKLYIQRCKKEYGDSFKAKAMIRQILLNFFMQDILYLFLFLFPLDKFHQNEFYSFNKLLNSNEFKAYYKLTFINFISKISSSNDLSTFLVIYDFYLYIFYMDFFQFRFKQQNIHILILLIDLFNIALNLIKSEKRREEKRREEKRREEKLLLFHGEGPAK